MLAGTKAIAFHLIGYLSSRIQSMLVFLNSLSMDRKLFDGDDHRQMWFQNQSMLNNIRCVCFEKVGERNNNSWMNFIVVGATTTIPNLGEVLCHISSDWLRKHRGFLIMIDAWCVRESKRYLGWLETIIMSLTLMMVLTRGWMHLRFNSILACIHLSHYAWRHWAPARFERVLLAFVRQRTYRILEKFCLNPSGLIDRVHWD